MKRVPVAIRRAWVPPGFAAWVPRARTIIVGRDVEVTERLLAHECAHVLQAERYSWPSAYIWQWITTGFSYTRMPFEVEARAAEKNVWYLAWARDLMKDLWARGLLDAP